MLLMAKPLKGQDQFLAVALSHATAFYIVLKISSAYSDDEPLSLQLDVSL